jgi:hypothetical protein
LAILGVQATSIDDTVSIKWSPIEGKLRELTVSRDFDSGDREIYGISSNSQIWTCRLPCDGAKNKWAQIPGTAISIAATEFEVWKTNADFTIDRCRKPCSGEWTRQPGLLRMISMGPEVLWGVNHFDDIFKTVVRIGAPPGWRNLSNGLKFSSVSVGLDSDVWAVLKSGEIARFSPTDNSWRRIPGKGKRISVGLKYLFMVDENDQLMRCKRPCTRGEWKAVQDGSVRVVAVEWAKPRHVYGLKPDNTILMGKLPKKCPHCCRHARVPFPALVHTQPLTTPPPPPQPIYQPAQPISWQDYIAAVMNTAGATGGTPPQHNQYDPSSPYWMWWMSHQAQLQQQQPTLWSLPVPSLQSPPVVMPNSWNVTAAAAPILPQQQQQQQWQYPWWNQWQQPWH